MIKCKITNKTNSGIALNWIAGSISIPKDSAAVLDYDPFTLMDRRSSVYFNAMADIQRGIVTVEYCCEAPAKMIESIDERSFSPSTPKEQEHKRPENKLFREQEPYHKNDFEANVAKTAPVVKQSPEDAGFAITINGETKAAVVETGEDGVETAEAPKTTRKRGGSKKL